MSHAHAAAADRDREVLTASPARLVVIVYDQFLINVRRARFAIEADNVTQRVDALGKARDAVMELLVSTDVERGGDIANNLRSLYAFVFSELMGITTREDIPTLDKLSALVMQLREAFATIAAEPAAQVPAA